MRLQTTSLRYDGLAQDTSSNLCPGALGLQTLDFVLVLPSSGWQSTNSDWGADPLTRIAAPFFPIFHLLAKTAVEPLPVLHVGLSNLGLSPRRAPETWILDWKAST